MDTDRNIFVYRYGQLLVALFIEKSNCKYLAGEYEESVQNVCLELGSRRKFQFWGSNKFVMPFV